jgi:hypothetical protein
VDGNGWDNHQGSLTWPGAVSLYRFAAIAVYRFQRRQVCVQGAVNELHLVKRATQAVLGGSAMQISDEGNGISVAAGDGFPAVGAGQGAAFGRTAAFEENCSVHRKMSFLVDMAPSVLAHWRGFPLVEKPLIRNWATM